MHALTILHRILSTSLPEIHAKQITGSGLTIYMHIC